MVLSLVTTPMRQTKAITVQCSHSNRESDPIDQLNLTKSSFPLISIAFQLLRNEQQKLAFLHAQVMRNMNCFPIPAIGNGQIVYYFTQVTYGVNRPTSGYHQLNTSINFNGFDDANGLNGVRSFPAHHNVQVMNSGLALPAVTTPENRYINPAVLTMYVS